MSDECQTTSASKTPFSELKMGLREWSMTSLDVMEEY
jgi:hypothetical protein